MFWRKVSFVATGKSCPLIPPIKSLYIHQQRSVWHQRDGHLNLNGALILGRALIRGHTVCPVPWEMFSAVADIRCRVANHESFGEANLSTMGDILCRGGIPWVVWGGLSEYRWGCSVQWRHVCRVGEFSTVGAYHDSCWGVPWITVGGIHHRGANNLLSH